MNPVLIETSNAGDIDKLYELIILKRFGKIKFEDTALHVAASAGQTCFAMEVMNLKPSFVRKLNKDGLSPMHLALSNGHSELVLLLLRADPKLVRVKGRGGITPLHYATQGGNIHLLASFLAASPKSIEDVTVQSETVLHIAVKNNMIEALEVLVGWLKRVRHKDACSWITDIPNWRDNKGETVLDIAVSKMQIKAISLLAQINAKNSKGLTALDALQHHTKRDRREIRQMLRTARQKKLPKSKSLANCLSSDTNFCENTAVSIKRLQRKISESVRNTLMVVTALIITLTFQVAFSPPGKFRKEKNDNPATAKGDLFSFLILSTVVFCIVTYVTCLLLLDSNLGVFLSLMLVFLLGSYYASTYGISVNKFTYIINQLLLCFCAACLVITIVCYFLGNRKSHPLSYNANKCPKLAAAEVQDSGTTTSSNESGAPNNTSA